MIEKISISSEYFIQYRKMYSQRKGKYINSMTKIIEVLESRMNFDIRKGNKID